MNGPKKTLAKLEPVELREVWQHEALEFTPWLAQQENLQLLGESIGLTLEFDSQEQQIGIFRADIVCRDLASDSYVLIENQLEQTDHKHLGQILTYAAGLKAATTIWVAQKIQEEHRAAIDWLNQITSPEFNFFAVEIQLWKIADSPCAPTFNIVSKPNNWSKFIAEQKQRTDSLELTPTEQLQQEYWMVFAELVLKSSKLLRPRKPRARYYMNFAVGKHNFYLTASINVREKKISASLTVVGLEWFKKLFDQRSQIEETLGPLIWDERTRNENYITVERNSDPADKAQWEEQHAWLLSKLELFHGIFVPLIRGLDLQRVEGENDDADQLS